ncbi:CCA tRNA nucleotidyltransferase [Haliangium ochraceum]|uniref:tRNA adenylyltransferase n=1 Tax=Haliangium ochraceum (strain DSM 14365 / JCM 11303 / SMP-2) TaxID=502025 RepID=D0LJ97_HALO1|nr:[cytidine(C)-cytidine(C)-adenosine (A)]-adding enzyme [Haliangium ochraceum]ACY14944.1 tRNA adenylyltransferase [Haliangium ochraceum DSM 14365]
MQSDKDIASGDAETAAAGDAETAAAVERIDATVPATVRAVCARLHEAGHQSVCVGGAVRDALLGRAPGDWDVATSAAPAEVQALFDKTVDTGIQHGTVTVMARPASGRGRRLPIEVTTFRGDGSYSDGRRPDSVTFGVPLREDLARRDFVINAMAYDPVRRALIDPFGGRRDLARGLIRAVGEPARRFDEDGLRVMRAVRFAAKLGFALDAATEAAIPGALGRLSQVSWERIRSELFALLVARAAAEGLAIAARTGILAQILPELAIEDDADAACWAQTLARLTATPEDDACLRLCALLWEVGAPRRLEAAARRLKTSNADRARLVGVNTWAPRWRAYRDGDARLRELLAALGRARVPDAIALWRAQAAAEDRGEQAEALRELARRAQAILDAGHPLATGELALSGGDVMRILDMKPGRAVGLLLEAALARVLVAPALNTPERLGALLPELLAALPAAGEGGARGSGRGPR